MSNGDARWCGGGKPARSRFPRSLVIISYARRKNNAPQNLFLKAKKQFSWLSSMRTEKHQQWVAWAEDFLFIDGDQVDWNRMRTWLWRLFSLFPRIFETGSWAESAPAMMCTRQQVDLFSCLINYNGTWYSHIVPETVILRSQQIWFICSAFMSAMSLQTKRTMACWKSFRLLCAITRKKKLHDISFDVNNIKASCRESKQSSLCKSTRLIRIIVVEQVAGKINFLFSLLTPATVGFSLLPTRHVK